MNRKLSETELSLYLKVFEFAYILGANDKNEGLYLAPKEVFNHAFEEVIKVIVEDEKHQDEVVIFPKTLKPK